MYHWTHFKGIFHMLILFAVFIKIHVIDKKLDLLEKKFVNK